MGSKKIADARIKLLAIQPRPTALVWNSFPIAGRARFIEELRKGLRKAANADTSRTDFLNDPSRELALSFFVI